MTAHAKFVVDHPLPALLPRFDPTAARGYAVVLGYWLREYGHLLRPDLKLQALAVTVSMPPMQDYSVALSDASIRPILNVIIHGTSSAAAGSGMGKLRGQAAWCKQITLHLRLATTVLLHNNLLSG